MKETLQTGFTGKKVNLQDGSMINYGEGPDNGPALLLIHGQSGTWKDYASVLPELSKKFHVFHGNDTENILCLGIYFSSSEQ